MKAMRLNLYGAFQSWGSDDSSWLSMHRTELEPTKSGIVGMMACAFGYPRGDERINELFHKIELYIDRKNSQYGQVVVDFQTVSSDGNLKKADPRISPAKASVVEKQYLADARFILYVVADEETLENIKHALLHPYWPYYLGRKCCIPSGCVFDGFHEIDTKEGLTCISQ